MVNQSVPDRDPRFIPIRNAEGAIIADARYPLVDIVMVPIFREISPTDLGLLLADAWVQHFPDGWSLFHASEQAGRFYVVLDGHVELFSENAGVRNVLEVATRPAMVGEAALFGDGLYSESARIVGHSRLLVVPGPSFLAVLFERFDLTLRMLAAMSLRLHGLVEQISSLKIKSTAQRLAGFLLGVSESRDGVVTARFPYDKRLVAQALGMTPESLSRALARLTTIGVHSRTDSSVEISDLSALRAFCGEDEPS